MNIKFKTSLVITIFLLFYCISVKAENEEPIKIGTLLSYSGVYAILGEEITNALELAFEEVNYEISGRKLQVIKRDTEVKPNIALNKARELISSEKVDILVGPVASSEALAIRDLVVSTKTPLIVANAGANVITGKKCSKYITRISFSNYQINAPMGPWLANKGVKTAFLLAPNYAAGKEQMGAFKSTFEASGGKIIGEEYTPFRKTKDFGPYLARIKNSGADAVYVFYAGGEAINFIKQAHSFGLGDVMKITGAGWTTSPLFIPAQKEAALGFIGILNYVPSIVTKENMEFQKVYKKKLKNSQEIQTHSEPAQYKHVYQLFSIQLQSKSKRDGLMRFLTSRGIMSKVFFDPIHMTQHFSVYKVKNQHLAMTEKISERILSIPMYPGLTKEEITMVANTINEFVEQQ